MADSPDTGRFDTATQGIEDHLADIAIQGGLRNQFLTEAHVQCDEMLHGSIYTPPARHRRADQDLGSQILPDQRLALRGDQTAPRRPGYKAG